MRGRLGSGQFRLIEPGCLQATVPGVHQHPSCPDAHDVNHCRADVSARISAARALAQRLAQEKAAAAANARATSSVDIDK